MKYLLLLLWFCNSESINHTIAATQNLVPTKIDYFFYPRRKNALFSEAYSKLLNIN